MRRQFARLAKAIECWRIERVLLGFNQRKLLIMAICVHGKYERIYINHRYGMIVLTPRIAAKYLKQLERREFERALSA